MKLIPRADVAKYVSLEEMKSFFRFFGVKEFYDEDEVEAFLNDIMSLGFDLKPQKNKILEICRPYQGEGWRWECLAKNCKTFHYMSITSQGIGAFYDSARTHSDLRKHPVMLYVVEDGKKEEAFDEDTHPLC